MVLLVTSFLKANIAAQKKRLLEVTSFVIVGIAIRHIRRIRCCSEVLELARTMCLFSS